LRSRFKTQNNLQKEANGKKKKIIAKTKMFFYICILLSLAKSASIIRFVAGNTFGKFVSNWS